MSIFIVSQVSLQRSVLRSFIMSMLSDEPACIQMGKDASYLGQDA